MSDQIAVYYESTIVYWSSVILCAALIAAFCFCFVLFLSEHRYGIGFWIYWLLAGVFSVYLSRIIHWYCHMEQYADFRTAVVRLDQGGYSIVGILFGSFLAAVLCSALRIVRSRYELLDAAAPGLAFLLAMVRFCDGFGGACLGKNQIAAGAHPFSYTAEIGGIVQTRFAVFRISFLWLLFVTVVTAILFLRKKDADGKRERGCAYRVFLILFCVSEIPVDSMRYDGLYLFFYGSKLAELNKVAGFIGLSQLVSAFILLGCMIAVLVRHKFRGARFAPVFLAGLALAGTCEYLVQRYTGAYVRLYALQILGSLLMGLGCILAGIFPCQKPDAML